MADDTNAWQQVATTPEELLKLAREREAYLNRLNTWRLTYATEGGMWSRNVEGTGAWFELMKTAVGKHIEGYGILTYIGPVV